MACRQPQQHWQLVHVKVFACRTAPSAVVLQILQPWSADVCLTVVKHSKGINIRCA
jgi:hypothetical protein